MYAVKWAITNGYSSIEIRYDYEGIEKWVNGDWRAKNLLTKKYTEQMNEWKKQINIKFCKVAAHSNNKYNDEADKLAKRALTDGKGIPKIKKGDYWFTAEGITKDDLIAIIELVKEDFGNNITEQRKDIPYGFSVNLILSKKDNITINYYTNGKLMINGKPKELFSRVITYITELVDVDEIPKIFNETFNLNISKENVKSQYQYYLPNANGKLDDKMERVLHQAVYNLNIVGDLFDGTFLAQPALRVLEGHLKKILIERNIVPNDQYIRTNRFNVFERKGAKYKLKSDCYGSAKPSEVDYLGNCYTFYYNNRHVLEHRNDPTAPLDTTKILDCNQAHDLIKRTLSVIDCYFALKN